MAPLILCLEVHRNTIQHEANSMLMYQALAFKTDQGKGGGSIRVQLWSLTIELRLSQQARQVNWDGVKMAHGLRKKGPSRLHVASSPGPAARSASSLAKPRLLRHMVRQFIPSARNCGDCASVAVCRNAVCFARQNKSSCFRFHGLTRCCESQPRCPPCRLAAW